MALTLGPEDLDFLRAVARMEGEGKAMKDIAQELGIAPSTLTYRLACLGYRTRMRIVDARTGEALTELFPADADCEPQEVAA